MNDTDVFEYTDKDGDVLRVTKLRSGDLMLSVSLGNYEAQSIWLEPALVEQLRALFAELSTGS